MTNNADDIINDVRDSLESFIDDFPKIHKYISLYERPFQQMTEFLNKINKSKSSNTKSSPQNNNDLPITLRNFFQSIISVVESLNVDIENNLKIEELSSQKANITSDQSQTLRFDDTKHEVHIQTLNYDTEIEINSLMDIERGWKVKQLNDKIIEDNNKKRVIGFLGMNRTGKTFLLLKLLGSYISNSVIKHTKCLAFLENKKHDTCFIDCCGIDQRLKDIQQFEFATYMRQCKAQDFFIQSYILNTSNIIILLFNEISLADQQLYNVFMEKCRHPNQILIAVHNFKHIYSIDKIHDKILELEHGFNLEHIKPKGGGYPYYQQEIGGITIKHLILAREDSQAGAYFNVATVSIINQLIINHTLNDDFNPLSSFLKFVQLNLKNYADMIQTNDKIFKYPIEYKNGVIQSKCKFGLSSFLRESFSCIIDKLEQNNTPLDHFITKDENFLLAFFFISDLKEDSLKITPTQVSQTQYSLKIEGKRMASTNAIIKQNGEGEDKVSSNDDFQVVVAFEVNYRYHINKSHIQTSYKKSILIIRIPKVEEKRIITSFLSQNYH